MNDKKINTNISFLRFIFCIAVLLYHLNILKGGYLAVCSFFVLTGFFFSLSISKSQSLINYYIKRLKKIYLPLLIVVLSTVGILSLLNISIFNFKSEITSILLGYNNYFQINANIDYFAKGANSPFTHLWYIGILLQIEFIFPLIFIGIKKIFQKINYNSPCIIMFIISIIGTIYFCYIASKGNITITYYDTLSRFFSFAFGVSLGLLNINYGVRLKEKYSNIYTIIFILYTIILIILFITISSNSKIFVASMIITTIITTCLISYANKLYFNNKTINNKFINFISDISYEIYLVQYPVIFLFTSIKIPYFLKLLLIISIVITISYIIHKALNSKKKVLIIILIILTLLGAFKYITMKDDTKEINVLKDKLNKNEKNMKQKQKEYLEKQKEEKDSNINYNNSLKSEEEIYEYVTNLKVVGVGDSVMLNAIPTLYEEFPNGYFDAKVSRSTCAAYDVLKSIIDSGITFDIVIFNLGTNDTPNRMCKDNLMNLVGNSKVFWLTATNPDEENSNPELIEYAKEFDNIYILYWDEEVKNHEDYLYSDYTHLKPEAIRPYVDFIKNGIYNVYLNEYKNELNSIVNKKNILQN